MIARPAGRGPAQSVFQASQTPTDAPAATRLKAEIQALVGPDGPSRELLEEWRTRFPPPTSRATKAKRAAVVKADLDDEEGQAGDEP